jgi:hypothetical protein
MERLLQVLGGLTLSGENRLGTAHFFATSAAGNRACQQPFHTAFATPQLTCGCGVTNHHKFM